MHGIVVAFHIYPLSGGGYPQCIFSLRNNVNRAVTFSVQLTAALEIRAGPFRTSTNSWHIVVEAENTLTMSKQIIL